MHYVAHMHRFQKPRTDVNKMKKKKRCNACVDWLSYYAHTWTFARYMDLGCRRGLKKPYYTIKCCRARYKVTIEAIYNSYNTPQLYNNES